MKVSVIGGLARMEKEYVNAFKKVGCKAKIFNTKSGRMDESLKCSECVVLLTKLSSHNMANTAKKICKKYDIPLVCLDKTSPESVCCALQDYINCDDCEFSNLCMRRAN
ncbi:hypothetical protein Dacet_1058 [Denitrovibrio acetiphilus DSM 12809]|uniref:DUF2325 domain-containing protein n=1 Tax=Denitrovibrio acetiphilus (strain DSM 12809 / NBRC 114555 / N2460) TaxID=522772 RepID=D4H6W8_DENA2|nr:DUF2325 domain-containing protein [Denitrovibrio acetiphilus]ADD67834.1 hypothetical protein Dacet_1058 [Denitrovibrio acetiphilus DSM 12809]